MTLLRFAIMIGLLIGAAIFVWQIVPAKSKLMISRDGSHFPVVSGYNLNRQQFIFPQDFERDYNLVIIPFQQYQQNTVNTWMPFAQELEERFPRLIYYELPTIYEMPAISRTFLNEGMRAGIPDQTARERTITLYLDKERFKSALDIPNENDIYLFLVDREGNTLWRTSGVFTEDKAEDLIRTIQTLN